MVESIPVHNNIKLRHKNYKKLINNYKDTIANIAKNNIKTICYNFMPIVDWTRTQLDFKLPTDGLALKFNYLQIIIFEMFILKLKDLDQRYTKNQIKNAEILYKKMKPKDLNNMKFSINSQSNGMTFCSGSLASNVNNDVYKIFNKFKDKIHFIHLRNVKIEKDKKSFYESNHLSGDVDFVKLIKMILKEEKRRSTYKKIHIPMRPDHGHCLLDDQTKNTFNPGYTAIGRLMGLSELRGIIKAVQN